MALAGCGDSKSKWVGTWEGQLEPLSEEERKDPIAYTVNRVTLEVNQDGSFELIRGGMPNGGRVVFSKNKSILRLETIMGRPLENEPDNVRKQNPDIEIEWLDSGKIRLIDPNDFGRQPLILSKRNE